MDLTEQTQEVVEQFFANKFGFHFEPSVHGDRLVGNWEADEKTCIYSFEETPFCRISFGQASVLEGNGVVSTSVYQQNNIYQL